MMIMPPCVVIILLVCAPQATPQERPPSQTHNEIVRLLVGCLNGGELWRPLMSWNKHHCNSKIGCSQTSQV